MLEPSFLRGEDKGHATYCCLNPFCLGIGYTQDLLVIQSHPARLKEDAVQALGFHDKDIKEQFLSGEEKFRAVIWYFKSEHREFDQKTGRWRLKTLLGQYIDDDTKHWDDFPPANYSPKFFLDEYEDEVSLPKNSWKLNAVPSWVHHYCAQVRQLSPPRRVMPAPEARKRAREAEARVGVLERQITSLNVETESLRVQLKEKDDELVRLRLQVESETEEKLRYKVELESANEHIRELQTRLSSMVKTSGQFLTFDDLKGGGCLSGFVKDYTYFDSYESNKKFLDMLNWTDDSEGAFEPGDDLCKNMRAIQTHVRRSGWFTMRTVIAA